MVEPIVAPWVLVVKHHSGEWLWTYFDRVKVLFLDSGKLGKLTGERASESLAVLRFDMLTTNMKPKNDHFKTLSRLKGSIFQVPGRVKLYLAKPRKPRICSPSMLPWVLVRKGSSGLGLCSCLRTIVLYQQVMKIRDVQSVQKGCDIDVVWHFTVSSSAISEYEMVAVGAIYVWQFQVIGWFGGSWCVYWSFTQMVKIGLCSAKPGISLGTVPWARPPLDSLGWAGHPACVIVFPSASR